MGSATHSQGCRVIPFLAIITVLGPFAAAKIVYVDGDAAGANDGTSWADAFVRLKDALTAAQYGNDIRVAQGIYPPDQRVVAGRIARIVASGERTDTKKVGNGYIHCGGLVVVWATVDCL